MIVRDVVFNATQVDFWLMGGSGGERALIACAVTTASGRQDLCQAEILTRAAGRAKLDDRAASQ